MQNRNGKKRINELKKAKKMKWELWSCLVGVTHQGTQTGNLI